MIDLFTPKIPSQPDEGSYGVVALQKFPRLSRAIYLANVGEQASRWNKDLVIKRWADHTVVDRPPTDDYRYIYLASDGTRVIIKEAVISIGEAMSVNLPGKYSWPKWKPELVQGYVSAPDGSRTAINPSFVSTIDQAEALMRELDGVEVLERTFAGPFKIIYDMREKRRLYSVKLRGTANKEGDWNSVGLLLKMKYRNGVGAPGEWTATATEPRWIPKKSKVPDEYDPRPEVPIPIRALLPNESARLGFAGVITIFQDADSGEPVDQDAILARIDKTTQQILKKVSERISN